MKVTAAYLKVGREGIHAIQEMHAQGMSAEQITERMNAGADPDAAPADVIQPAGGAEDENARAAREGGDAGERKYSPPAGRRTKTPGQPEKEETPANGVPTDEQLREAYDLDIAGEPLDHLLELQVPGDGEAGPADRRHDPEARRQDQALDPRPGPGP